MSVEFQEDQNVQALYQQVQSSEEVGGISKLIIQTGLAKDADGANKAMIGIIVVVLLITAFVIFKYVL